MLTNAKKAVLSLCLLFILKSVSAQQTASELNYVHDKMLALMQQSAAVSLPPDVIAKVEEINKHHEHKTKLISGQMSLLKVLYNTALKKEDILFFREQLLKNNSTSIVPIHSLVKQKTD